MESPIGFRAYVLDKSDHIIRRHDIEAENTTAALELAQQYVNGHDVEIWQHTHIVGRLKSRQSPP